MKRKRKNNNQQLKKGSPEEIREGIKTELRSIIRQKEYLRKPIQAFQSLKNRPLGSPSFRVVFDTSPSKKIRGLKTMISKLELPDEKILDEICHLAESVWHLKDRLKQWAKVNKTKIDIEALAEQSIHLLVCADLTNTKKHGRTSNRSGLSPKLSLVKFDTSQSGLIEFFYSGGMKEKELFVTNPNPIPYHVEILNKNRKTLTQNAVDYILQAFEYWLPIIHKLNVLKLEGAESRDLIKLLFPTKTKLWGEY